VANGFAVALALGGVMATAAPASAAPAWTVEGGVVGAQYGRLASVSCASTASCFAVGAADGPSFETKLAERWNGSAWSVVTTPNPGGAVNSQFTSVHCLTSTSCVAVGQYDNGVATKTLVERWNGSKWSIVASPNPAATSVSVLASVWCTSTSNCVAVGSWFESTPDSSAERTLVERWNGSKWSIVASPNKTGAIDSGLAGVACTSASSCMAVGHYDTNTVTRTLTERWDGSKWAIVASPNPGNTVQSELSGISCPAASRCIAVGSGHGTLAERWNGSGWSIMTTPNPPTATGSSLFGVSCPSTTRCYAVSDFFTGSSVQRLVETWNGTSWSIVAVPVPAGTIRSSLSGVWCATTTNCFAVGEYRLGPSRRPLIDRYA
jgi:hypothetical protein